MIPRLMRAAIVVSAAAAIACQTELGARSFPHLIPLNVTLFLVAAAAGRWAPQAARWTVFLPSCLFPAMLLVAFGHFDPAAYSVWMAAVLGLIVGTTGVSRWSLPPSWAWPLALWGLCVAGSWSIIAWRELDYTLSQLSRDITSVTSIGIPPAIEIVWIANVAATHLIGILWIDALCRMNSSERPEQGIRRMLGPFLVSVTASAAVGVYQMFGHVTVLNESIFGGFGRASGAMVDGNAFGMLTALWIAGAAIVGWSGRARWMRVAAVLATATLVTATWASGSRTALFVAAVIVIGVVYGAWRAARRTSWRVAAVVALTAVVLAGAVWVTRQGSVTVSPLARLSLTLDAAKSSGGVLATLWRRDGYGTVATAMIRRFPWTGVGVGMFNTFLIDQSRLIGLLLLEPDNAQNWFRHQFAETGVIGSLGWIFWLVVFLPSLFKKPPPDVPVAPLYILRAAIVGLGLASLVAMPTQNVVVLLTFWTLVSWHASLSGVWSAKDAGRRGGWPWAAALAIAAVYCGGVAWVGVGQLRVPLRAAAVGWPYDHGVYDLESPANAPAFRWTSREAVTVAPVPKAGGYLELTFWVHHPDVAEHPVHVRIRVRGRLVVDEMLSTGAPQTRYVRVGTNEPGLMIESWVDRTWQPAARGGGTTDERTLGLALEDWKFSCCPPPGAIRVD